MIVFMELKNKNNIVNKNNNNLSRWQLDVNMWTQAVKMRWCWQQLLQKGTSQA